VTYWFPAKRRGWGWGPPNSWQGWVVLAAFFALLAAGAALLLGLVASFVIAGAHRAGT
jgi:hypothetical protein